MEIQFFDVIKQGIGLPFKNKTVLGLIALYLIWGIILGVVMELYVVEPYLFGITEALILFASFFVPVVILNAITKATFENLNKRDISISNAVVSALKKIIPIFIGIIIYPIIVIVGLVVLIIPGIFLGVALLFYSHTISLSNKGIISSFKESYNIVKGNWWQVFALCLIFIIVSIFAGLLIGIFGLILPLHLIGMVLSMGITFLVTGVAMVVLTIVYAQLIRKEEKIQTKNIYGENIYEEKIFPKAERWILGIGIAFIVLLMAYILIGISIDLILEGMPLFDVLGMLFVILFVIWSPGLVGLGILITTMHISREFNVKITPDSVIVKYGFSKRTIPWEKIDDCYLLEKASIITRWIITGSGPWIRRVDGKWRLGYSISIMRTPRVVLSLREGRFRDFIFSTKNPEGVMKIINQQIGKIE